MRKICTGTSFLSRRMIRWRSFSGMSEATCLYIFSISADKATGTTRKRILMELTSSGTVGKNIRMSFKDFPVEGFADPLKSTRSFVVVELSLNTQWWVGRSFYCPRSVSRLLEFPPYAQVPQIDR